MEHLVEFRLSERQEITATTVSTLVVVIVDKNQSIAIGHQT